MRICLDGLDIGGNNHFRLIADIFVGQRADHREVQRLELRFKLLAANGVKPVIKSQHVRLAGLREFLAELGDVHWRLPFGLMLIGSG